MEYIEKKYETCKKAVTNLRKGVERFEAIKQGRSYGEEEYLERRDSLIKRFELAFDSSWKYAKVYLEVKAGLVQNSPKSVLRECLRTNLLTEGQVAQVLTMVDVRNEAIRTYQDEFAEIVAAQVPAFCLLLEQILQALTL